MSSFTENLYLKRQIQKLQEENNNLKRLIIEEVETPTQSDVESTSGTKDYGLTNDQSPSGYKTGFPPGYLPPYIMNVFIKLIGDDYYGLVQNGQINWANWALQSENNSPEFRDYIVPIMQALYNQIGGVGVQQFSVAFRQWQASQSRYA